MKLSVCTRPDLWHAVLVPGGAPAKCTNCFDVDSWVHKRRREKLACSAHAGGNCNEGTPFCGCDVSALPRYTRYALLLIWQYHGYRDDVEWTMSFQTRASKYRRTWEHSLVAHLSLSQQMEAVPCTDSAENVKAQDYKTIPTPLFCLCQKMGGNCQPPIRMPSSWRLWCWP